MSAKIGDGWGLWTLWYEIIDIRLKWTTDSGKSLYQNTCRKKTLKALLARSIGLSTDVEKPTKTLATCKSAENFAFL